ncbi:MAG: GNAT family N-acetyltransferase, partial [Flavobacteriaceae bacterium]|nr:GNAT family N-acetyltransferase [Flavobacteriaceae bacterium]
LAVMKMNSELGYRPVPFSELTTDQTFWNGCQTCKNYDILQRTEQKMCLCTGMLYDPAAIEKKKEIDIKPVKEKVFMRLKRLKQSMFLKKEEK